MKEFKRKYASPITDAVLAHIRANPGCTSAEVARAVRPDQEEDKYIYRVVFRLNKYGLVKYGESTSGKGYGLYKKEQ